MTAYEVRISDWSSDVCSSDLTAFGLMALGDVADNADEAATAGTAHLADGQVDRKDAAVLVTCLDLAAGTDDLCLAGGDIVVQVAVMLAVIALGHQYMDIAADHPVGPVTEHALGGAVEGLAEAMRVEGDDRRRGIVDDGAGGLGGPGLGLRGGAGADR